MHDQYELQDNQVKKDGEEINQMLPLYGQVQGEKVYLGGLDYSLLQKQKQEESQNGLLANIKDQLQNIQLKIGSRNINPTLQKSLDEQSIKLISSLKNLQNVKPLVNSSTYYLFDTRFQFGKLKPDVITKRFGRLTKQTACIKIAPQTIMKFKQILDKPRVGTNLPQKQKTRKKLIGTGSEENLVISSSDDEYLLFYHSIFGSDNQSQHKGYFLSKNSEQNLFNFDRKLDLGVGQDVFKSKKPQSSSRDDLLLTHEKQEENSQKDKYEFLRKKVKKSLTEEDDGYGECYFQAGPTFEELKQYRNQGIQFYGDLKQQHKNQKKPNFAKEFSIVKRIIDEKSKQK